MANLYKEINHMVDVLLRKIVAQDRSGFKFNGRNEKYTLLEILIISELSAGSVSMLELIKKLDMDRGLVATSVSRLVTAGYLDKRRSEKDRRVFVLDLTESGQGILGHIDREIQDRLGFVLKDMTINEQKAVLKFLSRVNQTTVEKYTPGDGETI